MSRTTLVLLHPFPLDAGFWEPVVERFADERPIVTPDFPGHGHAPPDPAPTIDGFADRVADRISMEEGGVAVVCGSSMGGYVALSLAARHAPLVAGLALVGTRAEADSADGRATRVANAARIRRYGVAGFLDDFTPGLVATGATRAASRARTLADRQPGEVLARTLEALGARPDRRAALAGIDAPTLVVVGEEDTLTPPAAAEALAAGIPGARLRRMPGSGHLVSLERTSEFCDLLAGLLAQVDSGGSPQRPRERR